MIKVFYLFICYCLLFL